MKPVIAHAGPGPGEREYTTEDFAEMYEFLADEWKAADTYLEQLGFPAQVTDEFKQFEYHSLTKRIQLAVRKDEED